MLDLEALDMNLLLALDALLAERNVTRAGKRIGMAQSSMSYALARLREIFDDPLFVRTSGGMIPTARAEELQAPLHDSIETLRRAIRRSDAFDPGSCDTVFRISISSVQQLTHLTPLLRQLPGLASAASVEAFTPLKPAEGFRKLRSAELDLAVGQFEGLPDGFHRAVLTRDHVVCLLRKGHPRVRGRLTASTLKREGLIRIVPTTSHLAETMARSLLEQTGVHLHSVLSSRDPLACLMIASQTDLIHTTLSRVATMFAKGLDLRVVEPPFRLPPIEVDLIWHERTHQSAPHRWFRELLLAQEAALHGKT